MTASLFTSPALNNDDLIRLIDERIALALSRRKTKPAKPAKESPFHTVQEIRRLILENLHELRKELGEDTEFDIVVLRHFLTKMTVLRPLDLEQIGGKNNRWEDQVLNAVGQWPGDNPPIINTRRRHYKFSPSFSFDQ